MKELICIVCPRGCVLSIDEALNVSGNACKRGDVYGKNELTNPVRTITSTVKITGGIHRRLPVMTEKAIPKHLGPACMEVINQISVQSPVKMGEVLVENLLETGVNLIATRNM